MGNSIDDKTKNVPAANSGIHKVLQALESRGKITYENLAHLKEMGNKQISGDYSKSKTSELPQEESTVIVPVYKGF
jgi:hypothetical protein